MDKNILVSPQDVKNLAEDIVNFMYGDTVQDYYCDKDEAIDEIIYDIENNPELLITKLEDNEGSDKFVERVKATREPKKPVMYIIKDKAGRQCSAPNPDDSELWSRVEAMEARGRTGYSVVAYVEECLNEELTDEQEDKIEIAKRLIDDLEEILESGKGKLGGIKRLFGQLGIHSADIDPYFTNYLDGFISDENEMSCEELRNRIVEFVDENKTNESLTEAVDPTDAKELRKTSDAWAILYGYKFLKEPEVKLTPEEHTEESLKERISEIVKEYDGKGKRSSKEAKETDFIFYVLYKGTNEGVEDTQMLTEANDVQLIDSSYAVDTGDNYEDSLTRDEAIEKATEAKDSSDIEYIYVTRTDIYSNGHKEYEVVVDASRIELDEPWTILTDGLKIFEVAEAVKEEPIAEPLTEDVHPDILRSIAASGLETGMPFNPDDFSLFKRTCEEEGLENVTQEDFDKYFELLDDLRDEIRLADDTIEEKLEEHVAIDTHDQLDEDEIKPVIEVEPLKESVEEVSEESKLEEGVKDYRVKVQCNDQPTTVVTTIAANDEKAITYAKSAYAQQYTTYADDRENKWDVVILEEVITEEKLDEAIGVANLQMFLDGIELDTSYVDTTGELIIRCKSEDEVEKARRVLFKNRIPVEAENGFDIYVDAEKVYPKLEEGSEDLQECEWCGKFFKPEDLTDSDFGKICYQCNAEFEYAKSGSDDIDDNMDESFADEWNKRMAQLASEPKPAEDNTEFNIGSDKVVSEEHPMYGKLVELAKMLENNSPNNFKYTVENTYEDFGADMQWTTVICHETGSWKHHQVLNTKQWLDLANDVKSVEETYKDVTNGEYFQDRKKLAEEVSDVSDAIKYLDNLDD